MILTSNSESPRPATRSDDGARTSTAALAGFPAVRKLEEIWKVLAPHAKFSTRTWRWTSSLVPTAW